MNLDALKGILIILVIVDHNEFSRSLFAGFLYGFGFHVVGFMTIPFLKPAAPLDRAFFTYAFRQYYPFFLLTTLMALVVALVKPVPLGEHLQAWALSLYSGNATVLKEATNMSLLWFLPSFISMVAIRCALEHAGKAARIAALAVICVAHLFIGAVAVRLQDWLPLGLLPALYVIPLGYLGVWLQRRMFGRMPPLLALALAVAVFVPVKYLQMRANLYNEVGFAVVADYTRPYALLLNDLECVTGVLMLFQVCRFRAPAFIEACGRHSIRIYLFHAFVALAVYKAVLHIPGLGPAAQFTISMAATVFLSLALARWLAANALAQRFVFPRSPAALLGLGRAADPLVRPVAGGLVPQAPSHPDLRR